MSAAGAVVLALLSIGGALGGNEEAGPGMQSPSRPQWPARFQISWEFTVPYIDRYQPGQFKYIYEVWQDSHTGLQKVVRDGVETVLIDVPNNKLYMVFPAYDKLTCWVDDVHRKSGPTLNTVEAQQAQRAQQGSEAAAEGGALSQARRRLQAAEQQHQEEEEEGQQGEQTAHSVGRQRYLFDFEKRPAEYLTFVLPDLTEKRWGFKGTHQLKRGNDQAAVKAEVYEWDMSEGDMNMTYRFFVSREGVPLRLWMLGVNLLSGGHKDEYVMDYFGYKPDAVSAEDFKPPADVDCSDPQPDFVMSRNTLLDSIRRTLPSVHHGDEHYDRFSHRHGRRHRSSGEYEARRQVFHDNLRFIQGWNAQPGRHRVAMNHFGDWTREEFRSIVTPSKYRGSTTSSNLRVHRPTVQPHMLPKQLSWKGTGADSPVKDQAACGSCWSFSTVAAFEAAYFRLTGEQQLFSEQQLIDCAWEVDNHGCYGGDQGRAFDWVLRHGGLARNEEYPYRGINDFCKRNVSEVKFTDGEMVLVEGGELAVMDTLLHKGPMTVSVDASADAFRFYAGGIFHLPDCKMDPKELDHAVILSGYGTTEDGVDYWLVKNIWSPFWGEEGYIRITRHPNDCGIASEPIYVDMKLA